MTELPATPDRSPDPPPHLSSHPSSGQPVEHEVPSAPEPEPEGARAPSVWPAAMVGALSAMAVAFGVVLSAWWLVVGGVVGLVAAVALAPLVAWVGRTRSRSGTRR